jgi:outer membrane protein
LRLALGLFLCFLLCSPAIGQALAPQAPPPKLSLEQAIANALRQHPSLIRLDETRQAAEARERAEASAFLPRLTLEAIGKEGPTSVPGFGFSGLVNSTIVRNYGASVVLSQMLYDFGRALHRTRSRRFAAAAVSADEQAQRAFVTLNIYHAYNSTLLAQQQVQLAIQDVATRELTARQAQARFDAGLTSRVDVDLARASLAAAQVALVNAENALAQAFADLNAAMGTPAGPTPYTLEDTPTTAPPAIPLTTMPEQDFGQALRQRPEIQSAEAQIRAAEEAARAAQANGLPLVRGLASGGYDNVAPGQFGTNHTYAVGVGISFPFYTGGQVQAEVADARHQAAALRGSREELSQTIRLQVTRARLALTSLAQSRQAVEEQLTQAQDSVKLASERYQAGLGNILELQQAQLALLTAETSAARLRYDTLTAQAALRYALGTLAPPTPRRRK